MVWFFPCGEIAMNIKPGLGSELHNVVGFFLIVLNEEGISSISL